MKKVVLALPLIALMASGCASVSAKGKDAPALNVPPAPPRVLEPVADPLPEPVAELPATAPATPPNTTAPRPNRGRENRPPATPDPKAGEQKPLEPVTPPDPEGYVQPDKLSAKLYSQEVARGYSDHGADGIRELQDGFRGDRLYRYRGIGALGAKARHQGLCRRPSTSGR